MDREKLNKAAIIAAANYDNPFDEPAYDKKFYDGFVACADWLMQQPLSERLTDEEKEKIREIYWQAAKDWIGIGDARGHCKTCIAIESIFGTDLFKEK